MVDMSRRSFLLSGAGLVASAVLPHDKHIGKLISYLIPPENIKPGEWVIFPTTCRECPAGCGMFMLHRDGRITKAEGNPQSPVSRGGLCARGQSSVQGVYDPDRIDRPYSVEKRGGLAISSDWHQAIEKIALRLRQTRGRVFFVSNLQTGAFAELAKAFSLKFHRESKCLFWEPFDYEPLKKAHGILFGAPCVPQYKLGECDQVLSFAADFLESWISPVEFAYQFSQLRERETAATVTYIGPRLSMTAANADEYFQTQPGSEVNVGIQMLRYLLDHGLVRKDASATARILERLEKTSTAPKADLTTDTIERLATAFYRAKRAVALGGPVGIDGRLALENALVAGLLNYVTGRIPDTVDFTRQHALSASANHSDFLAALAAIGQEDTVFIHEANPSYALPEAMNLIKRAGMTVYMGTMRDETAEECDWILPVRSYLEGWGDYEVYSGLHCLIQPTMSSAYSNVRSAGDLMLELAAASLKPIQYGKGTVTASFGDWVKLRWSELHRSSNNRGAFNDFWAESLKNGGYWGRPKPISVKLTATPSSLTPAKPIALQASRAEELALWPWASVLIFDGRVSNRSWLQESPDPMTSQVWGNCLEIHSKTAKALKLSSEQQLVIQAGNIKTAVSVHISDRIHPSASALQFGYGHTALGTNAKNVGTNAFLFCDSVVGTKRITIAGADAHSSYVAVFPTHEQHHRKILQRIDRSRARDKAEPVDMPLAQGHNKKNDLYRGRHYKNHRWAMVIDLQRCIGCAACAVACYSENNVATVGAEAVRKGREMAWLQVVRYDDEQSGRSPTSTAWIPMLCQHCDDAPCEPVCPVFASVHNEEGLNAQVYNRCVGTRYCSNNCPYKVRRFNWRNISWKAPLDRQLNPEVTVRARGVMEKCTFCIQRIRSVEHRAKIENRPVRDGEIQPACVQSCPAKVFTFGDLLDPGSQVSKLFGNHPRGYQVLKHLNTKPAVLYLKRIQPDQRLGGSS